MRTAAANQGEFIMDKRAKQCQGMITDNDRISLLPDSLLHYILSFLPTLIVVQTSVLSKRWIHLWRSTPSIIFNYNTDESESEVDTKKPGPIDFVRFVSRSLSLRDDESNIQSLYLDWIGKPNMGKVHSCIIAAVRHGVEHVDIKLCKKGELILPYKPPSYKFSRRLFTCPSLTILKLNLNCGTLKFPASFYLSSLKILSFKHVCFEDYKLSQAIASCPILETLIIDACFFKKEFPLVDISAPRLSSLVIKLKRSYETSMISSMDNCSSLVHAKISMEASCYESVCRLIRGLTNARSLTLSWWFIVTFAKRITDEPRMLNCISNPFNNLKFLKLGTCLLDDHVLLIGTLLKLTPNIETIFLKSPFNFSIEVEELSFDCELPCLKFVKFVNLYQVEFVKFFMKAALNIEKMIFVNGRKNPVNKEALGSICKVLVTYPRVRNLVINTDSDIHASLSCTFA